MLTEVISLFQGIHLIEIPSLKTIRTLQIERVYGIQFSPKFTYLAVGTTYLCKPGEQPKPNLFIVECATGEIVHSYVQQKQAGWEPNWFSDESYLVRSFKNAVMLYEPSDFSKAAKQINIERISDVSLSPLVNKKYFASYVPPSGKGQPAFCRIFNVEQADAVASKSFFKCDSVQFKWNTKGTDLLIMATSEVDKSNTSYYGEQALHYANVKGDSCMVQLKKKGPIYCHDWVNENFCVVYGFMPSHTTIFNLKCDPVWDLGEGSRNLVYLNPQGNVLLTAGFGNLQGSVETWDIEQKKRICQTRIPDTTHLEFASDGIHFLTATLAPRLRVNNGFKIWHYSGALKSEIVSIKDDPSSFEEMWSAQLQKGPPGPKPTIVFKKVEGIAQSIPKASKQAYRPPGMRAMEEAKPAETKKQNKKKPKPKTENAPPAPPKVDPSITKADDDDKKVRVPPSMITTISYELTAGDKYRNFETLSIENSRKAIHLFFFVV